ncbi:PXA domain-containing protein [Apiospora phragmitis]|uniref:PXA domain-containing protein n=1 Tax=Apiospora phragmitis TaxID=2905665 RepID=A0ABR1TRM7_9PEZI
MASTTPRFIQNSAVPTSVNATTEPTLLAASQSSTPARISSPLPPPPSNLRNARPVSTDFLSDKATIALIRRVLCAQNAADRGRSTPAPIEELLPPLTSRNDVDLQLYAFISIIIRDYVQTWYTKITPDETFVAEIVQIIAHCTRSLEQRLREVDLQSLLLDELPELLDAHRIELLRLRWHGPPLRLTIARSITRYVPYRLYLRVPKRDDPRSLQSQADNEVAYRQLLVQGVLALLLPTEDLENECLTSLVGQIFSELIIGNLFVNKLSEPWILWEILIIMTHLAGKGNTSDTAGSRKNDGTTRNNQMDGTTKDLSSKQPRGFSIGRAFWSLIQWGFLAVSLMRAFITTIAQSRSLPPRPPPIAARTLGSKSHADGQKQYDTLADHHFLQTPAKVPIAQFSLWPCLANLLEMDVRMPWLGATLSLLQWGAVRRPGKVAGYDGFIDRLLWHSIQSRLLDPARLPPLLRTIRAAVFPNNAPGTPGLVAPSSDEELAALRRRCASAVWALVPKMGKLLFFVTTTNQH